MFQIVVLLLGKVAYADFISKGNEGEKLILRAELTSDENIIIRDENAFCDPSLSGNGTQQILEESFLNLKACNVYGETLLHIAASQGRTEALKNLLKRGIPVDIRTKDSNIGAPYRDTLQTSLHYAAASGNMEVLRVLVDHSANISAVTDSGDTPLHKAALHGHTPVLQWLLDRGADVNAKNVFGATPLAMALINQRQEAAEVLLRRGSTKEGLQSKELHHWVSEAQCSPVFLILEFAALLIYRLLRN